MSVATSTAIGIGLAGASVAGNIYAAKKGAKASKEAAAQQQQGVREARAYAEPLYGQALQIAQQQAAQGQAGLAPYAQQGGQGLTALTALLGLPPAPAAGQTPPPGPFGAGQFVDKGEQPAGFDAHGRPLSALGAGQFVDKGQQPAGLDAHGRPLPGGGQTAPQSASSYVTLRAPTGEMRPVPADQVGYFLARGAQRV